MLLYKTWVYTIDCSSAIQKKGGVRVLPCVGSVCRNTVSTRCGAISSFSFLDVLFHLSIQVKVSVGLQKRRGFCFLLQLPVLPKQYSQCCWYFQPHHDHPLPSVHHLDHLVVVLVKKKKKPALLRQVPNDSVVS